MTYSTTAFRDADPKVDLIVRRFLNRTDRFAFLASWGKPCPIEGGDFRAALLAHLCGDQAPAVTVRWVTEEGKDGRQTGRFRLGTYSPRHDGATVFACVDCDGGGRHGNPLADPLGVALRIIDALRKAGLKCHLERSGSGTGWHVWVFFDAQVPAARVRRLLFALLPRDAPLKDGGTADPKANRGIEVFPKQDRLAEGKLGNMVWLPFWSGAAEGGNLFHRVGDGGEIAPYDPDDLEAASEADLDRALAALPAPPPRKAEKSFTYEGGAATDRERALSALAGLSASGADGYDDWLRVGMALHSVDSGASMLAAWDLWSRSCPDKYREKECAKKWESFNAGDGVTLGTLIHMAKQDGWTHPGGRKGRTRTVHRNGSGRAEMNGAAEHAEVGAHADAGEDERRAAEVTAAEAKDAAHLTDRGNAIRLARDHGHDLRHVHPWKKWLCWDGKRWRVDSTGAVNLRAKRMIAAMFREALAQAQRIAKELEEAADDGDEG